jgi:hypothetical protein
VRPEAIAFRELDTLVRNLGDQLAGYRRRAMAAEARTRELEGLLLATQGSERSAHARLTESERLLGDALRGKSQAEQQVLAAKQALTAHLEEARDRVPLPVNEGDAGLSPAEVALRAENVELRTLLDAARERTAQLLERTRFLRQQVGAGAEK